MSLNINKKVDFIVSWYSNEASKLEFSDQLRLLAAWIDICINSEEYEMAIALQKQKMKIIKRRLEEKKRKRGCKKIWKYWWIKLKRKMRKD